MASKGLDLSHLTSKLAVLRVGILEIDIAKGNADYTRAGWAGHTKLGGAPRRLERAETHKGEASDAAHRNSYTHKF